MLNITGLTPNDDPAYRYKMPRIVTKIEGRGNGIKTVNVNVLDVATALHRPPAHLTKFFGCELGAQSRYDPKVSGYVCTLNRRVSCVSPTDGPIHCEWCPQQRGGTGVGAQVH
jgi:translation initiation factor 2 beta subunit (eIF-2beta)/eIF-5